MDTEIIIDIRCFRCRRKLVEVGSNKNTKGPIEIVCYNSKCKAINNFVIYKNRAYLINKKLLKKKSLLENLKKELTAKNYSVILNKINS